MKIICVNGYARSGKDSFCDAAFYNINSTSYYGPMLNCIDFEEDYNNEMLDGGKWCRVMHLLEYDVEKICEKE